MLPSRLDRALGLERLAVPGALEHSLDQLRHGQLRRGGHERLEQAAEHLAARAATRRRGRPLGRGRAPPRARSPAVGPGLEPRERRVADAAPRPVRDPQERDRVVRVVDHLQVRDRVLDLGALVEARAADHLVGDALADEHVLEHAALRVRAVEDGDLAPREALLDERAISAATNRASACSSSTSITRTGSPSPSSDQSCFSLRSRLWLITPFAASRMCASSGSSARARSVRAGEVALELEDVADVGAAEAVDRLVRVADHEDVAVLLGEELEQAVLGVVRVLVLVDEDVAERLLPLLARLREALEDVDREQEQVVEVDGVRGEEALLVEVVDLGDGLVVEARDALGVLVRADERVLRVRDLRVDAARREALRVALELLEAALHEADLVGLVVDREVRAVAEPLRLAPQDPAAGGVEGQDPDRARGRPDEVARRARASPPPPCS